MPTKKRRNESESELEIRRLFKDYFESSEEEWVDKRVHAESVVDVYIESAQQGSLELPLRQELGEACFWLVASEGLWDESDHGDLVRDLLSPSVGLEMLSQLPRVIRLRESAEASLMRKVAEHKRLELRKPLTDDEIPF